MGFVVYIKHISINSQQTFDFLSEFNIMCLSDIIRFKIFFKIDFLKMNTLEKNVQK